MKNLVTNHEACNNVLRAEIQRPTLRPFGGKIPYTLNIIIFIAHKTSALMGGKTFITKTGSELT